MAFDPRQHVVPGQPLRIAAEQINWINQQMRRPRPTTASAGEDFAAPYTWVYARNSTGGAVSRWDVLEITGVDITPTGNDSDAATKQFNSMPVLTAGEIDESAEKWCVALEPIAAGKIGRVAVDGAVQVRQADVEKLSGAVVLWEGDDWAIVRPGDGGGSPLRLGQFTGDWLYKETKDVWYGGVTYEVYNDIASVSAGPDGCGVIFAKAKFSFEDEEELGNTWRAVTFDFQGLKGWKDDELVLLGVSGGLMQWIGTTGCETSLPSP